MSINLVSVYPPSGNIAVSVLTPIYAVFASTGIQNQNIGFSLSDVSGTVIPGVIMYSGSTVFFTNTWPLNPQTDYLPKMTGIYDSNGTYQTTYKWPFQTSTVATVTPTVKQYGVILGDNRRHVNLRINII